MLHATIAVTIHARITGLRGIRYQFVSGWSNTLFGFASAFALFAFFGLRARDTRLSLEPYRAGQDDRNSCAAPQLSRRSAVRRRRCVSLSAVRNSSPLGNDSLTLRCVSSKELHPSVDQGSGRVLWLH